MLMPVFLAPALLALGLSAWLSWRFCNPASLFHILDNPNERSLHSNPTPRSGGIAILAGLLAGGTLAWIFHGTILYVWIFAALVPVAIASYLDDRGGVSVPSRLLAHVFGAALLVLGGRFAFQHGLLPGMEFSWTAWAGSFAALVYVVWMINLYNFMDGMDGFAGGMAVIGFGFLAIAGLLAGNTEFAQICIVVMGGATGFLFFNFPPARIFMGDVGSSTLGLLAAAFSLWGVRDGVFSFWVAILVFSPFIADATITLVRRLLRREKIWQAHKTHYYQKLVQAGWGHRKTVLVEYAIMFGCGITALICASSTVAVQLAAISGWAIFYVIFFAWVSRHASERTSNPA